MIIKSFKLLGSGKYDLRGEERISYLWKCTHLFSKDIKQPTYEQIIIELLNIIYTKTQQIINDNKNQEDELFYDKLQEYMTSITTEIYGYNINTLNIKSLQCILIMELIEYKKLQKKGFRPIILENMHYWYDDIDYINMIRNYYEGKEYNEYDEQILDKSGNIKINNERYYILLTQTFLDLMKTVKTEKSEINFPTYEDIKTFLTGRINSIYDSKYDTIATNGCPNLKGAYILCFLGEMTLLELVDSLVNEIYLIGITPEIASADGRNMSPWVFYEHDMGHCSLIKDRINKEYIGKTKKFFDAIVKNKDKIGNKMFEAIINVLFYYYHEKPFYYLDIINDLDLLQQKFDSLSLDPKYIYNNKEYEEPHIYNHILPENLWFENNSKNYLLDSQIKEYLFNSLKVFILLWDAFITRGISEIPSNINIVTNNYFISDPMKQKYLKYKNKYIQLKHKIY